MTNRDQRRMQNGVDELETRWRRLPKDDRLICLWWCLGFSEAEIANHLGKSLSAVRTALSRATAHLR